MEKLVNKFPFNLQDISGFDPESRKEILDLYSVLLEDEKNFGKENIPPDTDGADCYFLRYFISYEMCLDFDFIEQDFFKHCIDKIHDFAKIKYHEHIEAKHSDPDSSHQLMVLSLILNGAEAGDEYCKGLIRYLFKTYHKPLYKQLKRFNRISAGEILELARVGYYVDAGLIGIILTMCKINNVALHEKTSLLYRYLNRKKQNALQKENQMIRHNEYPEDLLGECQEQVNIWLDEDKKEHPNQKKQSRTYWEINRFVSECLSYNGYPEDFHFGGVGYWNVDLPVQYTRTLLLLKSTYPKKDFSFEDVQHYTHLHNMIFSWIDTCNLFDETSKRFLGLTTSVYVDDECLFQPEKIVVANATQKQEDKRAISLPTVAPVEIHNTSNDELLAEIDSLRRQLSRKEAECKEYKSQLATSNYAKKESESLIKKYENDRKELVALREFAYNLEQETPVETKITIEEMKKTLNEKAYVVIGGHISWINKLKSEFPKWTYIQPSAYKTVDAKGLENKERVFFFTDYLNHITYGKFVAIAREKKIPISYLHGVNMEQIIRYIYESGK